MNRDEVTTQQSDFILYTSKDRSVIPRHIQNIFSSGEPDEESNVQKMNFAYSAREIRRIRESRDGCK
ncbi:MAG: hypothetical protein QM426_03580 [Euryarchaeota archaeon]|nr:hypothetical protein [Euryarchaeota archaeon]